MKKQKKGRQLGGKGGDKDKSLLPLGFFATQLGEKSISIMSNKHDTA